MTASNEDLKNAHAVRVYRRIVGDDRRAFLMAMGREHRSESVFAESVRRGEDELLSIPNIAGMRENFVSGGMSEAQARTMALDDAWDLVESKIDRPSGSSGLDDLAEHVRDVWGNSVERVYGPLDQLNERQRNELVESYGWDGEKIVDEAKARRVVKGGHRTYRRGPGARKTWTGEIREVGDGRVQPKAEQTEAMIEKFRRMGMSESAARTAAEGR